MRICISFLLFINFFIACGQSSYKVLDKSGRRPDWINGTEENFIITYGSGDNSEVAKNECLKNIRDQIITSIAINVRSKTEVNIDQRNGVTDEKFKYSIISQSANIPSLQGISLSKATGSYWEKVKDRDGNIKFGYYIKYPFPNSELNRLLDEYQTMNAELDNKLNYCINAVDTVSSFGALESIFDQLNQMQNTFIDYRKDKVDNAITALYSQVESFSLLPLDNNIPGVYSFIIKNKKGKITMNRTPGFKSNCATFGSYLAQNGINTVNYTYDLCKYTDEPSATLVYTLGNKNINYPFVIDVNENSVIVNFSNGINLKKLKDSSGTIISSECSFQLNSKYAYPFVITGLQFKYQNLPPVMVDGLNINVTGAGVKSIRINLNQLYKKDDYSSKDKAFPYFSGNISYKNLNTNQQNVVKFSDVRYTTDW